MRASSPKRGASRPSSIDRLAPEIKALIGKLRIDHGWTIDEILKRLRELGQTDVSRSALARHTRSIEEIGADLRHSRELAQALVSQVGDGPEDRTADLNMELLHGMMLRLVTALRPNEDGRLAPIELDPKEIMLLAGAAQKLASAKKTNADMVIKIRDAALKSAATRLEDAAKTKGLTIETVAFIRKAVLGGDE